MQGSKEAPKAPLGNNARPVQPLHQRTIRTNINFKNAQVRVINVKKAAFSLAWLIAIYAESDFVR